MPNTPIDMRILHLGEGSMRNNWVLWPFLPPCPMVNTDRVGMQESEDSKQTLVWRTVTPKILSWIFLKESLQKKVFELKIFF
jgi:hypothetical protein